MQETSLPKSYCHMSYFTLQHNATLYSAVETEGGQ